MRFWILGLFLGFALFSCEDGTVITPSDSPEAYHPLGVGKFWIYQVDSTIYDDLGNTICPTSGFVKEELTSVLSEENLTTVYVLERSYKTDMADPWTITDIWTLTHGRNYIQRSEENLRFVKMQTPLRVGNMWEGNQFDSDLILTVKDEAIAIYKNWEYEVLELNVAEEIGGTSYDDLMILQQADDENLIERRYSLEKYARDVGLVYREMEIFDTQCDGNPADCIPLTWLEKAERGYAMTQILIDHN